MVIVVLLALRRRKCFVLGHGCSPLLFLLGSFDVCVLRKLFVKLQKTVISVIPHELKWCDNLIVYDEKTLRWQFIVPDEFPFVPVRETQSGVLPTFSPDNTISGLPGLMGFTRADFRGWFCMKSSISLRQSQCRKRSSPESFNTIHLLLSSVYGIVRDFSMLAFFKFHLRMPAGVS